MSSETAPLLDMGAADGGALRARRDLAVGYWLLAIVLLIGVMVVVGGLTRLTGSGLSITEWRPVTGAIPPLSDAAWQAEFARYKGTSQYELINKGMGLAGFKSLYWWEWAHRLLGRLIGVVFAIPFVIFWRQKRIGRVLAHRLVGIFLLGAAQGALGWWMVKSGLEPSRVAVSQYRLAAHLALAIVLFGVTLWAALDVLGVKRTRVAGAARVEPWAIAFASLVFVQMILGAFMSGLHAGLAYDTWPDYAGAAVPPGLYDLMPWWINHFENPALVHFQHRTLAYGVALFAVLQHFALINRGADKPAQSASIHILALVFVQFALGVLTVVMQVPLVIAALHQICALVLFAAALWLVFVLSPPAPARHTAPAA